jgi:predicted SnoaL-like aldol condensation-catalyzing enzyme
MPRRPEPGGIGTALAVGVLAGIACACSAGDFSPSASDGAGGAGSAGTSAAGGAGGKDGASGKGGAGGSVPGGGAGTGGSSGANGGSATSAGGSAGDGSACDPSLGASNKATVNAALDALFVDKRVSAIGEYWADPYLQHNPIAQSGVQAFTSIMSSAVSSPSFSYERLRTLAECDLAVVQGRYSGTGVIFDMFRLSEGKLVEHWDSDANQASSASGPTEVTDPEQTGPNRAAVLAFLGLLIAGDHESASDYLATDYVEHRNGFLDGLESGAISYSKVHHVIADENFVFTLSEGELAGSAYAFYDLFRLEDENIAEHWDSRRTVPSTTASGLGIF